MEASERQGEQSAEQTPKKPAPRREVLVVELEDESESVAGPKHVDETLDVQVSAEAPRVIVPAAARPCPGATGVLVAGAVAVVVCFLPVIYPAALAAALAAVLGGMHLLRRIDREPYLTGRGVINTAILLGAVSGVLSLGRLAGVLLFWSAS